MVMGGDDYGNKKYYFKTSYRKRYVTGRAGRYNHGNKAGGIALGKWRYRLKTENSYMEDVMSKQSKQIANIRLMNSYKRQMEYF